MRQKSGQATTPAETLVRDIRRATRRQFSAEEKIRIVLSGLRGEDSIAELCRRESISQNLYSRCPRRSWRPARSAWRATPPARPPQTKSRPCARKRLRSRRSWPISPWKTAC